MWSAWISGLANDLTIIKVYFTRFNFRPTCVMFNNWLPRKSARFIAILIDEWYLYIAWICIIFSLRFASGWHICVFFFSYHHTISFNIFIYMHIFKFIWLTQQQKVYLSSSVRYGDITWRDFAWQNCDAFFSAMCVKVHCWLPIKRSIVEQPQSTRHKQADCFDACLFVCCNKIYVVLGNDWIKRLRKDVP